MSEQCLDREQIRTVLIKMCAKGMSESMAGKPVFHAEFCFFCKNKLVDGIGSHRALWIVSVRKKKASRISGTKPVLSQDIQSFL